MKRPRSRDGEIDPLSPEHVVTLVRFLASPAAKAVNGQVFVVYGPQVTLLSAPTLEHRFTADAQAWEPASSAPRCRITLLGATRNGISGRPAYWSDRTGRETPLVSLLRIRTRYRMICVTIALTC